MARLQRARHTISQREDEIHALRKDLERAREQIASRDRTLEGQRAQDELKNRLRVQLGKSEGRVRELEAELGRLKPAKSDPLGGRVRELEMALSARDTRLGALQRELEQRDRGIAELKRAGSQKPSAQPSSPPVVASPERALAAQLEIARGKIRELEHQLAEQERSRPAQIDDFTRIKGIGPKFARRLAELGVGGFSTMAAWDADAIQRMAGELKIPVARIQRDDWVGSAAALSR